MGAGALAVTRQVATGDGVQTWSLSKGPYPKPSPLLNSPSNKRTDCVVACWQIATRMAGWAAEAGQAWRLSADAELERAMVAEAAAALWRDGSLLKGVRALYAHDVDVSCGTVAARLDCDQVGYPNPYQCCSSALS